MAIDAEVRGDVVIRPLHRTDLTFAALLHLDALGDGFFARLGVRFLRSYYWSFAVSPYGIALVADIDGSPAGVIVGTKDDAAHYRHVLRSRWWRLGSSGIVALLRRPRLLFWFIRRRARRYCRGALRLVLTRARPTGARVQPRAVIGHITHLAVAPEHQGTGVGVSLVEDFTIRASTNGVEALLVVTRSGPHGKAAFYERCGWLPAGRTTDLDGVHFDQLSYTLSRR